MIAAVLHLHIGARPLTKTFDEMSSRLLNTHDIIDKHSFARLHGQVGKSATAHFFRVTDHVIDFRHRRERLWFYLGGAAGNDKFCMGMFPTEPPDCLSRAPHGLARNRTRIDDHTIFEPGRRRMRSNHIAFVGIEAATQRQYQRWCVSGG